MTSQLSSPSLLGNDEDSKRNTSTARQGASIDPVSETICTSGISLMSTASTRVKAVIAIRIRLRNAPAVFWS